MGRDRGEHRMSAQTLDGEKASERRTFLPMGKESEQR